MKREKCMSKTKVNEMKIFWGAISLALSLGLVVPFGYTATREVGAGRAYSTIQAAVTDAQPGDTVLVNAGTYSESVSTERDGAHGKRITIKAGGKVVLRGGFNIKHSYISIDGFEITASGGNAIFVDRDANYCEILNNNIHDFGPYRAIYMPKKVKVPAHFAPTGCLIKGNWIHGSKAAKVYIALTGINHIIEDNEIGPGVIIEDAFRPFGDNHVIRNNYIHDVKSGGGHTDVFQIFGVNNWRVRNLVFEKNTIINWKGQPWMADCTPDSGIITIRNIFQNIRGAGISYCPQTRVYNNVFHETGYGKIGKAIFIRSRSPRGSGEHSEVRNNIFSRTGGYRGGWYSVAQGARSTFKGDHNLVFPRRRGFREAHGINGKDPLFMNPSTGDFHLQSGSPAINSGTTLTGFNDDKDGKIRSDIWDIGPYEYYGSASTSPPRK